MPPNISERKVTIYLPVNMQKKLITLAQRNKLKNLRKGVRREDKLPETMGAVLRKALEDYFKKKDEEKNQKAGKEVKI